MNDREARLPPSRRLLRAPDDRMVAGVAAGLGRHFDIDPVIFRVGFVVATFFGGLGLVAYLALWIAVPEDDGWGNPVPPPGGVARVAMIAAALIVGVLALGVFDGWGGAGWWWGPGLLAWVAIAAIVGYLVRRLLIDRRGGGDREGGASPPAPTGKEPGGPEATTAVLPATTAGGDAEARTEVLPGANGPARRPARSVANGAWRVLGICLAIVLGAGVALVLAGASALATAEGLGIGVAAIVVALGLAVLGAAFTGVTWARWLIVPAIVLALPMGAVAAADIEIEGGYGESDHRPASVAAIPVDGYRLAAGELTIDTRSLPWRPGERVRLPLDLGLGAARVLVPDRVCVEAGGEIKAGAADIRGNESWGAGVDLARVPAAGRAPRLILDADLVAGYLEVIDVTELANRGWDFDQHRGRGFGEDGVRDEEQVARADAACAPLVRSSAVPNPRHTR